MSAGNRRAILAALRANLGPAAAKLVGWAVTGAASMRAAEMKRLPIGDAVEARVRARVPIAHRIAIEPDVLRRSRKTA